MPVVVLPIVEREGRCFELYTPDVCYPRKLFPMYGIPVSSSNVNFGQSEVVSSYVRGLCNIRGDVGVPGQRSQVEV